MSFLKIESDFQQIFGFSLLEGKQWLVRTGTNLIFAIAILLIGFWFAKWVGRLVVRIMTRSKVDAGLITFLSSLSVILLKVLVLVTAITQLGIEMTSFVAILGAAGLAIGMAFSGTLSNFAGGVMILLFKPFKLGDTIFAQNQTGTVKEIQIFYTYMLTGDNKMIVLPNGLLANGLLVNQTKEKTRRVEWSIPLENGSDYELAKKLILSYLAEDKLILKDPAPFVSLGELGSTIKIVVRAWAKTGNNSDAFFHLNERVYLEFPKHKLVIKTTE
ncbi:MAG TPA: mechanosensitive ion channel [Fluviicola sp.]|nr:mechanosensitive ion channel [Fluviicola sp.]